MCFKRTRNTRDKAISATMDTMGKVHYKNDERDEDDQGRNSLNNLRRIWDARTIKSLRELYRNHGIERNGQEPNLVISHLGIYVLLG